jgi:DNA invertase Pin-like site-specific DNA recombinase
LDSTTAHEPLLVSGSPSDRKSVLFCPFCHLQINVLFLDTSHEFVYDKRSNHKKGDHQMKLGYIRVSRDKQTTALQEDAMRREQCERTFTDKMTGKRFDRPEFLRMLDLARADDVIVVWRLDRLGRSLKDLIETVQILEKRGIELRSLKENIDTSTPTGKLMFHMMAALAEFERDVIRERTLAGLEAARARGRKGGRRKASERLPPEQLARAKELYAARQNTIAEIMALTGFKSRNTFYKYVVNGEG